ncbi:type II toxin-antitoxin system RelE/ParE family toxin [Hymenobacter sp. PAMC 26628]|uniref:type II toxin-antitoxin system RelE/ParE family toxin n=1 Tax=Hymenobacter sp. PAMC 26628 TaxID=1484118 RepID=UPI0009020325|nr:type II toxin-antitoxin system RelE/ParE family toxin [Hymenobacter sp. PAMC 26628]
MAQIVWSNPAIEDLHQLREFYSQFSEGYANRLIDKLIARVDILINFPQSGRMAPQFKDGLTRELVSGDYSIIYRIHTTDTVVISRIQNNAKPLTRLN